MMEMEIKILFNETKSNCLQFVILFTIAVFLYLKHIFLNNDAQQPQITISFRAAHTTIFFSVVLSLYSDFLNSSCT
ncbi:hypothetical protein ACJX0J_027337, partial [Zea mays]